MRFLSTPETVESEIGRLIRKCTGGAEGDIAGCFQV
jgi:hypothetical protein